MSRWGKDFLKGKKRTTLAWKCISIALAFVLVETAFEKGMFQRVFVLAATEAPEEESTEEADPTAGLLDDENGRINFWKWEKVTPQNWKDFYEDEKYHASMFVYYDNTEGKNPGGFLSIYADSNHVFRTSKNERTEFDVAPNIVLDGRYNKFFTSGEKKRYSICWMKRESL